MDVGAFRPSPLPSSRPRALEPDQSQPRPDAPALPPGPAGRTRHRQNFSPRTQTGLRRFPKISRPQGYLRKNWRRCGPAKPVAYFSAEFGFHESIPNYSGGLGILSGDHCKSASDLDLNFVAIGLLYRHGYFRQEIDKDGIQHAISLNQSFHHLPIREVRRDDRALLVTVRILDRDVYARLWELHVGRVKLYLLDTDIPENNTEDRRITAELYGGDLEMRMRQEIVLGIGGVNALNALGIEPEVFHMNEGHSAFLGLERIRRLVAEKKLNFYAALQLAASANVFTTHTPVPAGNDSFPRDMMRKYFGSFATEVGVAFRRIFSFGQTRLNATDPFSMTILALRLSRHSNGVSKLHGEVSRGLWKDVWTGVPEHEVPITSVTNGIHTKTWLAPEFSNSTTSISVIGKRI